MFMNAFTNEKLTPLESIRRIRQIFRKAKRGLNHYLEAASDRLAELVAEQSAKEDAAKAANTPLTNEQEAEAIFRITMAVVQEAFVAGGLFALHQYDYDILGTLDEAEEKLEALTPEQQVAFIKAENAGHREGKNGGKKQGSGKAELEEMVRNATGKSLRELSADGKVAGGIKISGGGPGGEGQIEFLGPKPSLEEAEHIGNAVKAALLAAAGGQKGPIEVGDVTLMPMGDDTPLNKMN